MKNFTQILKNFFAGQGMKQGDVAEKLNLSRTIVTNYLNGNKHFGRNSAMRWSQTFGIDPLWLMTQGEQGVAPNVALPALVTPTTDGDVVWIPVLNLDIRGGLAYNDEADIEQYSVTKMPFSRSMASEGDIVVPVYGDSMSPRYPSGSFILIRPLPLWREWLELGNAYVLELVDNRRMIKIVRKGSTAELWRLDSYNIDYEPTELPIKMVQHVFQVLAVVKREVM